MSVSFKKWDKSSRDESGENLDKNYSTANSDQDSLTVSCVPTEDTSGCRDLSTNYGVMKNSEKSCDQVATGYAHCERKSVLTTGTAVDIDQTREEDTNSPARKDSTASICSLISMSDHPPGKLSLPPTNNLHTKGLNFFKLKSKDGRADYLKSTNMGYSSKIGSTETLSLLKQVKVRLEKPKSPYQPPKHKVTLGTSSLSIQRDQLRRSYHGEVAFTSYSVQNLKITDNSTAPWLLPTAKSPDRTKGSHHSNHASDVIDACDEEGKPTGGPVIDIQVIQIDDNHYSTEHSVIDSSTNSPHLNCDVSEEGESTHVAEGQPLKGEQPSENGNNDFVSLNIIIQDDALDSIRSNSSRSSQKDTHSQTSSVAPSLSRRTLPPLPVSGKPETKRASIETSVKTNAAGNYSRENSAKSYESSYESCPGPVKKQQMERGSDHRGVFHLINNSTMSGEETSGTLRKMVSHTAKGNDFVNFEAYMLSSSSVDSAYSTDTTQQKFRTVPEKEDLSHVPSLENVTFSKRKNISRSVDDLLVDSPVPNQRPRDDVKIPLTPDKEVSELLRDTHDHTTDATDVEDGDFSDDSVNFSGHQSPEDIMNTTDFPPDYSRSSTEAPSVSGMSTRAVDLPKKRPTMYQLSKTCDFVAVKIIDPDSHFKVSETPYKESINEFGEVVLLRPPSGTVSQIINEKSAFQPITSPKKSDSQTLQRESKTLWILTILLSSVDCKNTDSLKHGDFLVEVDGKFVASLDLDRVVCLVQTTKPSEILVARPSVRSTIAQSFVSSQVLKEHEKLKFKYEKLKEEAEAYLDTIADLKVTSRDNEKYSKQLIQRYESNQHRLESITDELKVRDSRFKSTLKQVEGLSRDLRKLRKQCEKKDDKIRQLKGVIQQLAEEQDFHHTVRSGSIENVSAV